MSAISVYLKGLCCGSLREAMLGNAELDTAEGSLVMAVHLIATACWCIYEHTESGASVKVTMLVAAKLSQNSTSLEQHVQDLQDGEPIIVSTLSAVVYKWDPWRQKPHESPMLVPFETAAPTPSH